MAYDFLSDHRLDHYNPRHQFAGHHIASDQMTRERLKVVYDQLAAALRAGTPGDIVELGCYVGTTSLYIRRLLDQAGQSGERPFHVYDSFAGLPEKSEPDQSPAGEQFETGALRVSKRDFIHEFQAAALAPPIIHKGWFNELTAADLPKTVAFAFLDGDYYQSIIDSLRLVWPVLSPGGRLLVDDFKSVQLPGVERAIADFFRAKDMTLMQQQGIAIITKA